MKIKLINTKLSRVILNCMLIFTLLLTSCSGNREGKVTIVNKNVYTTTTSLFHNISEDSAVSQTVILKPGSSIDIPIHVNDIDVEFYIHQQPAEEATDFLLWLANGNKVDIFKEEQLKSISNNNVVNSKMLPVSNNLKDKVLLFNDDLVDQDQDVVLVPFNKVDFSDSWGTISGEIFIEDALEFTPSSKGRSSRKIAKEVQKLREQLDKDYIKYATFEVFNMAPYKVYVALWSLESRSRSVTKGWYSIEAGEKRIFANTFKGVVPNFAVYGESASEHSGLIRQAFNLDYNHPAIKYFQPEANQVVLSSWINETDSFNYTGNLNLEMKPDSNAIEVAFNAPIIGEKLSDGSYKSTFMIQDTDLEFVQSNVEPDINNQGKLLTAFSNNAKILFKSLDRQHKFEERFPNFITDSPYLLGLQVDVNNNSNLPGVKIEGLIFTKNILGQPMPFKSGDILLELNNELVFDRNDMVMITNEHATDFSRGISKPITFKILRGNQLYEGETMYYYNPKYKNWPASDWLHALFKGSLDALSLGFDDEIYNALSKNPKKAYHYIENKFRLQQFYKGCFLAGNISAAILSPAGLILKGPIKSFLRIGVGKKLSGILAIALVEGVENVAWTYGNNHKLYSQTEFTQMLRSNFKLGAGFGMVFGSFNLIRN